MDLGVTSWVWHKQPLETAVKEAKRLGVDYMEVCAGGYFGTGHCDPTRLMADERALQHFRAVLDDHGMTISALAMHGEPLHPESSIADAYDRELRAALALAERLEVRTVTLLAGLPSAGPRDSFPNWVTYPFPARNREIIDWQWTKKLVPYWRERGKIADAAGVRLAFELHPADMCYQPSALMALREEVGPVIGANFDPSHLLWQRVDPPSAIHYLGSAIYNVHAKESQLNSRVCDVDGVLESRNWDADQKRSWNFRTAGYSQSLIWWRNLITALRAVGYEGVLAYEHEDPLIETFEGLEKGVDFLRKSILERPRSDLWYM